MKRGRRGRRKGLREEEVVVDALRGRKAEGRKAVGGGGQTEGEGLRGWRLFLWEIMAGERE